MSWDVQQRSRLRSAPCSRATRCSSSAFQARTSRYDPHYLGLRAGAQAAPAFTFLNRVGTTPREEISALATSAPRMRIVQGDLPAGLSALALALDHGGSLVTPGWDPEMDHPGIRMATLSSDVTRATADSISPVQATVVLASIAEAAGSTDAAFHLLTRTMPHHSKAGLLGDPAMQRQQRMLAAEMIEMAACTRSCARNLESLRSKSCHSARCALTPWASRCRRSRSRFCGQAIDADAAGLQALRESRADFHPARRADTICVLARGWTVFERWAAPHREVLREEYERMFHYGDEPRRIRVGALYGRFLIEAAEIDAAEGVVVDCQAASRRLKLPQLHNDLVALGGRLYLARGRGADALGTLRSVSRSFRAFGAAAALCGNAAAAARGRGGGRRCRGDWQQQVGARPAAADVARAGLGRRGIASAHLSWLGRH